MMAPRNANFQPHQSIRPKAIDEPKRFINNNASKVQSPSGKLPVGRLRDRYPSQIGLIRRYVGRTAFTQELIRQINRKGT